MKQAALSQHHEIGERSNVTAAIEIEKRDLRTAALSAMASLCAGPIQVTTEKKDQLYFDVRRMLAWIDQIFKTDNEKVRSLGRRALEKLIITNFDYPYLLERSIEMCYVPERPDRVSEKSDHSSERRGLEDYFEVVTKSTHKSQGIPLYVLENTWGCSLHAWKRKGRGKNEIGEIITRVRTTAPKEFKTTGL